MPRVFLAFENLGLGVQLVETLEATGLEVMWPGAPGGPPPANLDRAPDVVVLGDLNTRLDARRYIEAWRALNPPPGVVVLAGLPEVEETARGLRATVTPAGTETKQMLSALDQAHRLRYTVEMSLRFASHAVGVPWRGPDLEQAIAVGRVYPKVQLGLVREALRPHVHRYVASTPLLNQLRECRGLPIPAVGLATILSGAITVDTALKSGRMSAEDAARTLWMLLSIGAAAVSDEPPDESTTERRAVTRTRRHLRERYERLRAANSHYYEVLEVSYAPTREELDAAARRLAIRFSPARLASLDLGDMAGYVAPLWEQIQKAWQMLVDPNSRAHYNAYLKTKGIDIDDLQDLRAIDPRGAESDFLDGQRKLSSGEVYKAVSMFASAARRFPGNTDYEAYLAWARYRASIDRGEDKAAASRRELDIAEAGQYGRGARPRSLLALGLLCAAGEDLDSARWHLNEALTVEPDFAMARQILGRLGG